MNLLCIMASGTDGWVLAMFPLDSAYFARHPGFDSVVEDTEVKAPSV